MAIVIPYVRIAWSGIWTFAAGSISLLISRSTECLALIVLGLTSVLAPLSAQVSITGTNNPVVEKNDYIVRFSPRTGSYSLYKREIGKNRLVRLINDREPRSTYIAVALNGRVYTLGRSTRYLASRSERITLLTDGGVIFWKLPQRVNIKYYVRVLSESSLTSYIRLNIVVENGSSITQSIGLFHMFDVANNNLGLPAFSLPDGDVFRETILETRQVPYFVQTSYNAYFYLDVRGSTRPDRVILANWTKLHEAGWNYGFQLNSQGFGYNLYDSNNPALGIYYDARPLSARQSRSYVIYLAFDAVPSFSNFSEYDDAQILPTGESAEPEPEPQPQPQPNYLQIEAADDGLTDELLRQLIKEQRRNNELLEEQMKIPGASPQTQVSAQQLEPETRYLSDIDIQALYQIYHSEDKRFSQLQALQDNLNLMQKLQQSKLQQLPPYLNLESPTSNLQAWRVEQRRMAGQLDNWNTFLVNVVARLPQVMHDQPEFVKFHNNLRDLRLALREVSEQWSPLIQRVENTWEDWQNGKVGEPVERLSRSLYQSQQALVPYMNELSDLARYSNGVQQRLQSPLGPLYGELSDTMLAVRQRLTDISEIIKQLHQNFAYYVSQAGSQLDIRARLQKSLFSNEQQLTKSGRELEAISSQLQVAFSNIRLLEQWQEEIDLNQSRLAYDPYRKENEIKELLNQISKKIDEGNLALQDVQRAQTSLQSELDQQQTINIAQTPAATTGPQATWAQNLRAGQDSEGKVADRNADWAVVYRGLPDILRQALAALPDNGNAWPSQSQFSGSDRETWQLVQLVNPYPYESGQSSARNKMSDTVRPPIDEDELYNALKGFPQENPPPLPQRSNPQGQNGANGSSRSQALNRSTDGSRSLDSRTNPAALDPSYNQFDLEGSQALNRGADNLSSGQWDGSNLSTQEPYYQNPPVLRSLQGNLVQSGGRVLPQDPSYQKPMSMQDLQQGQVQNRSPEGLSLSTQNPNYQNQSSVRGTELSTQDPGYQNQLGRQSLEEGQVLDRPTDMAYLGPDGQAVNRGADKVYLGADGQVLNDGVGDVSLGPKGQVLSRSADQAYLGGPDNQPIGRAGVASLMSDQRNLGRQTLVPGSYREEGVVDRAYPPGAEGGQAVGRGPAKTVSPDLVDPNTAAGRAKIPSNNVDLPPDYNPSNDPYRDVKRFIRDVGNYLENKNFYDQDVDNSEKRWSYLERKYNIQQ